MSVRLVDHATGKPLSGVNLAAVSRGGKQQQVSTDGRGRAAFHGLGQGQAAVSPAGSKGARHGPTPCTIKSLVGQCQHKRRSGNQLQVVAERTREDSFKVAGLGIEAAEEVVEVLHGHGVLLLRHSPSDADGSATPSGPM